MKVKGTALFLKRVMVLGLVLCLLPFGPVGPAFVRAEIFEEYQLMVGDILTIPTNGMSRLSITNPDVADISDAKPRGVTLMGMAPGQTILFIWEDETKRNIMVTVIAQDFEAVKRRLASLFESAGIYNVEMNENTVEGKLILTGDYPEDKEGDFQTITGPFSDQLLNLSRPEDSKDLIQIDVQITELSTTLSKSMGVKWNTQSWTAAETPPAATGELADIFKIGKFSRTTAAITAQIDFLLSQGKARILSKPRIVVNSGKEATFLVGGEIPIVNTTTSDTGTSSNVEYKEYGVSLSVTPTIKEGKIELTLNTEISDVDGAPPPTVTGSNSTSFLTRSVQTEVLLDDRQTIVLAGLIKKNRSRKDSRVPLLGSIPIVGLLFRSADDGTAADTEVVISLTPTIIHQSKIDPYKTATQSVTPMTTEQVSVPRSVDPVDDEEEDIMPLPGVTTRNTIGSPTITKNVGTSMITVPAGMAPYVQMIQKRISSAIAFPYEAQQNGWQGTVKLAVVIKKDGSLRDVYVKESSGYEVFDQDGVNTTQILAPYEPFPNNIKEDELSLTIPIVYSLDSFLKNVANRN